jgi:hypothetical protein
MLNQYPWCYINRSNSENCNVQEIKIDVVVCYAHLSEGFQCISQDFFLLPIYQALVTITESSLGFFFSHCSGVKHFGVQACIRAISSFNAVFTSRCRASVVFFSNCGDTIVASKAWPQPPAVELVLKIMIREVQRAVRRQRNVPEMSIKSTKVASRLWTSFA